MKKRLSITNDFEVSQIKSFIFPLLTIGIVYASTLIILTESITFFLYIIIALSIISALNVIDLIIEYKGEIKEILKVDARVRNYSNVLARLEAEDDFSLDKISKRCKITREEGLEQIKKINDVDLAGVFKTLDIVKGEELLYDKEKNILYMTLEDFKTLKNSYCLLQNILNKITEELICDENLNKSFFTQVMKIITLDIYSKSLEIKLN